MEMTVGNAKTFYLCIFYQIPPCLNVINYLITESEVVTGKLKLRPRRLDRGLRYFRND